MAIDTELIRYIDVQEYDIYRAIIAK